MMVDHSAITNVDKLFALLESENCNVVSEIKQLIYEQFTEVSESWLVNGLYEYYCQSGSGPCLELILNVRDPHDKYLCDKISEGLRCSSYNQKDSRGKALTILGYLIRKRPSWLPKITTRALMKDLIKICKGEEDIELLMSGLLDLLTLIPILPVHISPFLQDLFEIFSRVAFWKHKKSRFLADIHGTHLHVTLFAFFHRLYGMFPCNFLHFLRSRYSENNKETQAVYLHVIKPMMVTVRLHPLLVTHSREHEKTPLRWKKMDLHDVIVESSRYALLAQESSNEGINEDMTTAETVFQQQEILIHSDNQQHIFKQPHSGSYIGVSPLDSFWTPGRKHSDLTTPPLQISNPSTAVAHVESPPETAIEATPETTPFVTPSKDENIFRYTSSSNNNQTSRPTPSSTKSRSLRNIDIGSIRSPISYLNSPMSAIHSPFPFPPTGITVEEHNSRRDSIFDRTGLVGSFGGQENNQQQQQHHQQTMLQNRLSKLGAERNVHNNSNCGVPISGGGGGDTLAISSNALLASSKKQSSPVAFTSQVPIDAANIRPQPSKIQDSNSSRISTNEKMLTLDTLQSALPYISKEEDDDEVAKLTGGSDIQMIERDGGFNKAGNNSVGMLSTSSSCKKESSSPALSSTSEETEIEIKKSEGSSVNDFMNVIRGRMRYISVCGGPNNNQGVEMTSPLATPPKGRKRNMSCPDAKKLGEMHDMKLLQKMHKSQIDRAILRSSCSSSNGGPSPYNIGDSTLVDDQDGSILGGGDKGNKLENWTQTDQFHIFPYEHLFPQVLPNISTLSSSSVTTISSSSSSIQQQQQQHSKLEEDQVNPYLLLDSCLKSIGETKTQEETLKCEINLLHNQLLYERYRREILGNRNRRLLGKTKSSRILEEENNALRDQLLLVKSEIGDLHRQIEEIRREKHEVEEERAQTARSRDHELEDRQNEIRELKINRQLMNEKIQDLSKTIENQNKALDVTKAALFTANAELDILKEKETVREASELELIRLRKELLMMGELQQKYNDELQKSSHAVRQEELDMMNQAKEHRLHSLIASLETKSSECQVFKARITELESLLSQKDGIIGEKKRLIKKIQEENQEVVEDAKRTYDVMVQLHCQTEGHILELRDQLAQNTRVLHHKRTSSRQRSSGTAVSVGSSATLASSISPGGNSDNGKKTIGASGLLNFNATKSVDIEKPELIFSPDDRSFIVGSPPLSSGGSLGSDKSEVMRRTLESTQPINVGDFDNGGVVEIGSAVSAKEEETFPSSLNGKH